MLTRTAEWIKRHQVAAFFIITFAITWGLGFSYGAVRNRGTDLLYPVAFVATCGPALAGIIISRICNTEPASGSKRITWIAFLVALIVATLVFVAFTTIIEHVPLSPPLVIFTPVMVSPVAFVISRAYSRTPAVKHYLSSLLRLRGVWGWCVLALVLKPALMLLSIPVSAALGRQSLITFSLPDAGPAVIGLVSLRFLYQFFFFNAIGEEVGWRGFALPRLQERTSPLVGSLVVALFWLPWHFFLWKAQSQPVSSWDFWAANFVQIGLSSIITGWFYNRSNGSILVAGVAHAAANTAFRAFFSSLDWTVFLALMAIAALVLILADRMWRKLPPDHPAVYHELALNASEPRAAICE